MKMKQYISLCMAMLMILTGCTDQGQKENDQSDSTKTENVQAENMQTEDAGIDLQGTYDENDLIVKGIEKKYGEIIADIPQIEGLLDKQVEEKINDDIMQKVTRLCENMPDLNFADYTLNANFANVLSVSIYLGSDEESKQEYLNYNLVDGEKIRFEELFRENTDTLGIIREAFHESLVLSQMTGEISENEFYKVVKSFSEEEDKKFVFTPSKVYLYQNEHVASVRMEDIADEVIIYSRYLTEDSLYETNNIGMKEIMTCVTIPDEAFDCIDFGYLHENCWFDITVMKEYVGESVSKDDLAKYRMFKKDRYDEFYEKIEQYGQEALNNPDKFYIILSKPSFYVEVESELKGEEWMEHYTGKVDVNEQLMIYEMPKTEYENIYKKKIVEAYRYDYLAMAGGIYLDASEDNVRVTDYYQEKTYNYLTGEEID